MIDEETRRMMREMGMGEMVEALDLQECDGTSMAVPFDDRMRMMVDCAYEEKYAASVKRLVGSARLRFPDAEMREMIYEGRRIDELLIREAGTCQFMARAANVVIEGCTGTGKTIPFRTPKTCSFCPGEKTKLRAFGSRKVICAVPRFVPNTHASHAAGFDGKMAIIDDPTGIGWNDATANERERVGVALG